MQRFSKSALLVAGLILVIIIGFLLAFIFNTDFRALKLNPFKSSKLNILVIGYDSSINGPPRADTILLASIDLKTREVGVLSIPRDTRVSIPGHGVNRINAAHAFGGIDLTVQTLESFLNVPIDYYVETDFDGFARIIDAIGGVELTIKESLHYVDKAGGLYIDLPAGRQKLNGEEALEYVRFREELKGDIGRIERQQKFLKAMVKSLLNPDIIVKLPAIYKETRKAVNTNIPIQDISPFIHLIKDMKMEQFKTVMLPGEPKYINGASYWIADKEKLEILVNNLIRSKEYITNSRYQISILNGNGVPGLANRLASEIEKYGFKIGKVANADNFNYKQTLIKYFDTRDKKIALGIRRLIGGKIVYQGIEEDEEKDNLKIIIGADYFTADQD